MPSETPSTPTILAPRAATSRRVVLVVELDERWAVIARGLEAEGIEVDLLSPRAKHSEVVACATRSDSVVVVDLKPDASGGMTTVAACRRAAATVPVIVVADNPSLELARSVRLSGAFYLALQPIGLEEMRTILQSAFQCSERRRASASTCRATRRILVIDDDADFVASTAALLEAHGYGVLRARSGREGLELMMKEHPDLVIVDIMMENEWAGYEVNEAIKFAPGFECVRHVPVVMVSSITLDPATRFSHSEEVDLVTPNLYLTKPLDLPRFISEIEGLLGEPRNGEAPAGPR
ncbi:MAG TPA: response regulator [Vicinamibacterales bacterium]|nr:response regulator [Vicinamibacterales bacterium]